MSKKAPKGKGSRAKLREFFIENVGKVLNSDTLREVAGTSEWGRRVRELRNEEGMNILTHNDRSELKPGQYLLVDLKPLPAFERGISKDSLIMKAWQGVTSGLDMLQIYKDTKVVVNDYGDIADGEGVNQRIYEVMGVGSLLLTRESDTLKRNFPENTFATFRSDEECKEKIKYFLSNDTEREEIAKRGQEYISANYNYDNLMKDLSGLLKERYFNKFEPEAK